MISSDLLMIFCGIRENDNHVRAKQLQFLEPGTAAAFQQLQKLKA